MSLRDEFHAFLDTDWPLWKLPKNRNGVLYNRLWRAFAAGLNLSDEGVTPARLGKFGRIVSAASMMNAKPRKFKAPKARS